MAKRATAYIPRQKEVYTFAPGLRGTLYFFCICLAVIGCLVLESSIIAGLLWMAAALPVFFMAVKVSVEVVLTPEGIVCTREFRRQIVMRWEDVDRAEQSGFFAPFVVARGGEEIRLSKYLHNFFRIISAVQYYRPDLFESITITRFHRAYFPAFLIFFTSLVLITIGTPLTLYDNLAWTGEEKTAMQVVLFGCALLLPLLLARNIRVVVVDDRYLRMKYLFYEKRIAKDKVEKIAYEEAEGVGFWRTDSVMDASIGTMKMIAVHTSDGQKLLFNHFREGDETVYKMMRQWLTNNQKKVYGNQTDISLGANSRSAKP